jgi:hypothetical protein
LLSYILDTRFSESVNETGITAPLQRSCFQGISAAGRRAARDSFAAELRYSDAGVPALLGHAGHSITQRYIEIDDSASPTVADRVAEEIIRLMDTGRDDCTVTAEPPDDAGQPQVS